jgi:hypothetical protein
VRVKNMVAFNYRKRSGKYNACLQTVDGITFHSKKEAAYYSQLKIERRAGLIKSFERQVSFDLYAFTLADLTFKRRVCAHIVDFVVTRKDGSQEVREVKGFATDVWDLKRKLFEANYPELPYRVIR